MYYPFGVGWAKWLDLREEMDAVLYGFPQIPRHLLKINLSLILILKTMLQPCFLHDDGLHSTNHHCRHLLPSDKFLPVLNHMYSSQAK